jgi:hypothetical protein
VKEQIKEALDYANKENTWVTNIRDYREIEEMLEGAVEHIEQLEKALEDVLESADFPESVAQIAIKALGRE